jgi:alpha-ribazole phosphatase/probable phosphoglycerate mutase
VNHYERREGLGVEYLFVVRHGETEANVKGIDAGPMDFPLTTKGVKEAKFISKALSEVKVAAVYSSPVFRAVETAKILAKPHGLKVTALPELTEAMLKPKYIGKKGRHHVLSSPEAFSETLGQIQDRVWKAVEKIKKESKGDAILVSHGDVVTALLERVVERDMTGKKYYVMHPHPASLSVIDVRERPFLVLFNFRRKMLAKV